MAKIAQKSQNLKTISELQGFKPRLHTACKVFYINLEIHVPYYALRYHFIPVSHLQFTGIQNVHNILKWR